LAVLSLLPISTFVALYPLWSAYRLSAWHHGIDYERSPFSQSIELVQELERHGMPHEFYPYEGLQHYFSTSADKATTQQRFRDSLDCLRGWLGSQQKANGETSEKQIAGMHAKCTSWLRTFICWRRGPLLLLQCLSGETHQGSNMSLQLRDLSILPFTISNSIPQF
jgi:hypothetical protein